MRLTDVRIRNFRSIEEASLANIGSLNILIGKNNSGKSTLLSAIETFFSCIRGGRLIALDPPIGRTIDYHRHDTSNLIELVLDFDLSENELAEIQSGIMAAAPQLRAAAEAFSAPVSLRITVAVSPESDRFSFVRSIELVVTQPVVAVRTLLRVSLKAAEELVARQRTVRSSKEVIEVLDRYHQNLDEDDFRRMKASEQEPRRYIGGRRYYIEASSAANAALDNIVRVSTSLADMKSNLASYKEQVLEEISKALTEPISTFVETFSGEQLNIPTYAQSSSGEWPKSEFYTLLSAANRLAGLKRPSCLVTR